MPAADRPRVLFIHPAYPNQFTRIARVLHDRGDLEIVGLIDQSLLPQAADDPVPHLGFRTDGVPTPASYPFVHAFEAGIRQARGLAHRLVLLRRHRPVDVVVGHAGFGATLYARSLLGCAVVAYAELPGYHAQAARPEFPFVLDQLLAGGACEALTHTSLLHADLGVVPSHHARQLFPPELQPKIRVQMEGFEVSTRPPGGPAERRALGLPAEGPIVGFFGRTLEAVRGFDVFAQVMRRLREIRPDLHVLVIGEEATIYGNETPYLNGLSFKQWALQQAGLDAGSIHWRGFMPYDAFRQYLACLDLAILPLFEGAGNWNVLEAMAAGVPLLTSTRAYVPEVLNAPREAILLDPYDLDGFVRHARLLLDHPERARALGRAAQARLRRDFSPERAADGYRRIIDEAMERRRSAGAAAHGWHMTHPGTTAALAVPA
ncbi:MAG: glycosyltransferase [Bacteroidetes bacterium]|nr:MAG: glycosyltransferase [Bacteroidota bacterium]